MSDLVAYVCGGLVVEAEGDGQSTHRLSDRQARQINTPAVFKDWHPPLG